MENMNMKDIIQKHEKLERELRIALSTMERKDTILDIKTQLIHLQNECPHFSSEFNWVMIDNHCPYCGKKIG